METCIKDINDQTVSLHLSSLNKEKLLQNITKIQKPITRMCMHL